MSTVPTQAEIRAVLKESGMYDWVKRIVRRPVQDHIQVYLSWPEGLPYSQVEERREQVRELFKHQPVIVG